MSRRDPFAGQRPAPGERPTDAARTAHGATEEALDRPAGEYLAAIPWESAAPDPDAVDAATFLAWL